jgi:Zn-finger protein
MADCEFYPCHFRGQDCAWCYCPFYPCLDPSTGGKYKDRKEKGRVWSCIDCHWVHKEEVALAIKARIEGKQLSREELLRLRVELLGGG